MTPAPAAGLAGADRDAVAPAYASAPQDSPRHGARADDALWMRGWLLFAVVTIAYLFVQILMFGYGRDQGIYAVVADTMLKGGMPYRDVWDFKPPGIFFIYAAARLVLGHAPWAIRLVEVIGLTSMLGAFVVLARRFFGDWRIGVLGGALAVLVHAQLEFWHTAQPESFGGIVTAWALALATWEPATSLKNGRARQLAAWGAAGALYGFAFLLKPPLGGGALVTAAFVGWSSYREEGVVSWRLAVRRVTTALVVMGAAAFAVVALCLAWFAARGAFRDLYETLFVFTPHYTKLGWADATIPGMVYLAAEEWLVTFSSLHAVTVLAAIAMAALATRERQGVLHVLLVVAVQLFGVALQGKFYPYHYGAALLLGSLIAGLGAYKLWRLASRAGGWAQAAYIVALPLIAQARTATRNTETDFLARCVARHEQLLGISRVSRDALDGALYSVADVSFDANRRVAEWLRAHVAASDPVFIWGFEPVIYDSSERAPASRFIYDVPQRVAWFKAGARARLMADLDARPPRAIVVEHRDVFPTVTGDTIDSADTLREFSALADRISERYELATRIEDFDVYLAR